MKSLIPKFLLILIFISLVGCTKKEKEIKNEIKPYVDFLKNEDVSAKDYIINLFEKNDLVIICERFHPELTQYELFLEISKDPRFIKNVGNIFIETCGRNQEKKVDFLLKSENLSEKSIDSLIMDINRNSSLHPLWHNFNFPYFLRELQNTNNELQQSQKINLYPSDVTVDWKNMDSAKYKDFWKSTGYRDSLMADYISNKFETIQLDDSGRKKALIIMNYRHAFGNNFMYPDSEKPENVGRYLFDKYPERVANVLLNTLTFGSENEDDITTISNGKWDASFKTLNKDNVGFNLKNSPFGKDYFDLWIFTKHNYNYSDVFNGFIHYTPIEKIKLVVGVPNIVDSSFLPELKRRNLLVNKARGVNFPLIDSILWKYNDKKVNDKIINDSIKIQIDKWLE